MTNIKPDVPFDYNASLNSYTPPSSKSPAPSATERALAEEVSQLFSIANSGNFKLGKSEKCIGHPEPFKLPAKPSFLSRICGRVVNIPLKSDKMVDTPGFELTRQYIKADASSWARSTMQTILANGLKDDDSVAKIALEACRLGIGDDRESWQLLADVVAIFQHLKDYPEAEARRTYLNHSNVDKTLSKFMRRVDYKMAVNNEGVDPEDKLLIKKRDKLSQPCGHDTLNRMSAFFNVPLKVVAESASTHTWEGTDVQPKAAKQESDYHNMLRQEGIIVFGCNLRHFEVLHVTKAADKPVELVKEKPPIKAVHIPSKETNFSFARLFKNIFK